MISSSRASLCTTKGPKPTSAHCPPFSIAVRPRQLLLVQSFEQHTQSLSVVRFIYCTSAHTSRTISKHPKCWNNYSWPVQGNPPWAATARMIFQGVMDAFDQLDAKYNKPARPIPGWLQRTRDWDTQALVNCHFPYHPLYSIRKCRANSPGQPKEYSFDGSPRGLQMCRSARMCPSSPGAMHHYDRQTGRQTKTTFLCKPRYIL